jgi:hypothetical protein
MYIYIFWVEKEKKEVKKRKSFVKDKIKTFGVCLQNQQTRRVSTENEFWQAL